MLRLKKGCLADCGSCHIDSFTLKGANQRRVGRPKLPFTPLENLHNQRQESPVMSHRRTTLDPHCNESTLLVGNKLPRSSGGNIREKISLWEGKESSGSLVHCPSLNKIECLTQNHCKTTEEQDAECWRVSHKENLGKSKNGDSGPCSRAETDKELRTTSKRGKSKENLKVEDRSKEKEGKVIHKEKEDHEKETVEKIGNTRPSSPAESGKQMRVTLKSNKPNENQNGEDCRAIDKEKQEKENVEKSVNLRPCSPAEQQEVGTLRKSKKSAKQTSQEKRAVFTLFRKLEAMGENLGKTPTELGNYFSPPSKDNNTEVKKKEFEGTSQTSTMKPSERGQNQENMYTEPGAPPINPVPKPQRTFQHPATALIGKGQRQGRGRWNLPPLPSSSKPPSGVYGRPRGERVRDNMNRYIMTRNICVTSLDQSQ